MKLFEGTSISDIERDQFLGIYLTSVYKSMLEMFIAIKGNDKGFVVKLGKFFNESQNMLDDNQKRLFEETVNDQRKKILDMLVELIKKNVDEGVKNKIEENYRNLKGTMVG